MASLAIRNLDDSLVAALNEIAAARGIPREKMLTELLVEFVSNDRTHLVIGWLRLDRWGEIDDRDEPDDALAICDQCGQDIDIAAAYMAVMGDGKLTGPYCTGCAVSD